MFMKKIISKRMFGIALIFLIGLIFTGCSSGYMVNFDSMGGTEVDSINVRGDSTIPIPSVLKEGFILEGWYTSLNGGETLDEKWSFTTSVVNNTMTLYAKWIVNEYTISFESNGGSEIQSIVQDFDTNVLQPIEPTREGYTFGGWYLDVELTQEYTFTTIPSEDIIIYVKWDITQYKSLVTYEDIVYKTIDDESLTVDILMPTIDVYETVPVIIYIHGGNFTGGDKSDLTKDIREDLVSEILDAGYAIVTVNYRLLNEDRHFPTCIVDVKDAIRYVHSVSETYNFDESNFGLMGNNSGAYIALTSAYSPSGNYYGDYALRSYSAEVNYVIDMYGTTQISTMQDIQTMTINELNEFQTQLDIMFGSIYDVYDLSSADYTTISVHDPISYVSNDTIPTFIIHGLMDDEVNIQQSRLLAAQLDDYDVQYEMYEIAGGGIGLDDVSEAVKEAIIQNILGFMNDQYATP